MVYFDVLNEETDVVEELEKGGVRITHIYNTYNN